MSFQSVVYRMTVSHRTNLSKQRRRKIIIQMTYLDSIETSSLVTLANTKNFCHMGITRGKILHFLNDLRIINYNKQLVKGYHTFPNV